MNVRVRYYALFRELTKCSQEVLFLQEGCTLKDLLTNLSEKYPRLRSFIESGASIILRNHQPVSDSELKTTLNDNDIIDIMPPPSGGSVEVRLLGKDDRVSLDDVVKGIKDVEGIESCGAIAIYIGFVKGIVDGVKVHELTYEVNEEFTLRALNKILNDVIEKNNRILAAKVFHRVGSFKQGDEVLWVAVAGVSRRDVIPALTEIIERVKHETGIWKLEKRDDGSYWVLGDGVRFKSEG